MPIIKWIFNLIILIIFVALVVFSVQWINEKNSLTDKEEVTPYVQYITDKAQNTWEFFTNRDGDSDEVDVVRDLSSALKEIKMDKGDYPDDIKDIVNDYIQENSLNISSDMFFYEKTDEGFEIGVRLGNGEEYKINVP